MIAAVTIACLLAQISNRFAAMQSGIICFNGIENVVEFCGLHKMLRHFLSRRNYLGSDFEDFSLLRFSTSEKHVKEGRMYVSIRGHYNNCSSDSRMGLLYIEG